MRECVFVGGGGRVLITDSEGAVAPKSVTDTAAGW